jgi:uncharacterized protein YdhG (YjbR/CyaY superfamily)
MATFSLVINEHEEPCEGRLSRRVLGEGRGEVPLFESISGHCKKTPHRKTCIIMDKNKQFETVKDYFNAQPEKVKFALQEIKECIYKVVPEAEELFNYNIPAYTLVKGGKREQQIMIAGYKNHIGLYPHPTTMEYFDKELSVYKKGKGSVQFPLDQRLPKELIIKMITYRLHLIIA